MIPHGCAADLNQNEPAAGDGATECSSTVGAAARGDSVSRGTGFQPVDSPRGTGFQPVTHRPPPGAVWNGNPAAEPRRDPAVLLDVLADRAVAIADRRDRLTRSLHAAMRAMSAHCRAHRRTLRAADIVAAYGRVYARVERRPADEGEYDGDLLPDTLIPDEDPGDVDVDDNRPLVRIGQGDFAVDLRPSDLG